MSALRLTTSALVTLVLLGLCAVLAQPAFELPTTAYRGGIGAGAIPQFVVIGTVLLALAIFSMDIVAWRRRNVPAIEEEVEEDVASVTQVLGLGVPVLLILAGYVFAWRQLNFLITTIVFFTVLSILLAGEKGRTRRGLVLISVTSILFCTGVWALFVHVLKVPLR